MSKRYAFKRLSDAFFKCEAAELKMDETKSSKLEFFSFFLFSCLFLGQVSGRVVTPSRSPETAPTLDCKLFEGSLVDLSLYFPQHLTQCFAQNRRPINTDDEPSHCLSNVARPWGLFCR